MTPISVTVRAESGIVFKPRVDNLQPSKIKTLEQVMAACTEKNQSLNRRPLLPNCANPRTVRSSDGL